MGSKFAKDQINHNMKKSFFFLIVSVIIITLVSQGCSKDVRLTGLTLSEDYLEMSPGDTIRLKVLPVPENALCEGLLWTSSDESKASVDPAGLVTALSCGRAVISVSSGEFRAECNVEIPFPPASVGDFYYSDGTYSSELDKNKEVIGVVFWTGDPTENDPALRRDCPECTHGLVVAASGDQESGWQSYYKLYDATIGEWVEANAPEYMTTIAGRGDDDFLNKIVGYNNTKAMELFNADPANSEWPVDAVEKVVAYRGTVPAPTSTSDWYVPSIKELSLMISGEYDGNIYEMNESNTSNVKLVNEKLAEAEKEQLETFFYWSSSEDDKLSAFRIGTEMGYVFAYRKGVINYRVRFVLAF